MRYDVLVKARSKKGPFVEAHDDHTLTVYVREPAIDGRANEAVIALIAAHFGIPKTSVGIIRGHTSKHKLIEV